jgi:hypothetical protein
MKEFRPDRGLNAGEDRAREQAVEVAIVIRAASLRMRNRTR